MQMFSADLPPSNYFAYVVGAFDWVVNRFPRCSAGIQDSIVVDFGLEHGLELVAK